MVDGAVRKDMTVSSRVVSRDGLRRDPREAAPRFDRGEPVASEG